jgi:restriction system protein
VLAITRGHRVGEVRDAEAQRDESSKSGQVPSYPTLFEATFAALRTLGGSASNEELLERVIQDLALPPSVVEVPHGDSGMSEIEYRLAWARTYLKNAGLVANSGRGVWAFTPLGKQTNSIDGRDVVKRAREASPRKPRVAKRSAQQNAAEHSSARNAEQNVDPLLAWKSDLREVLLSLAPSAFERLCQRLLRESGFTQVEVTGRSSDGGIDGHGIVRVAGLLSFPVLFQCKRWKGTVPPTVVRDFRGAMVGRADKGLILTTGRFSVEARREATRDGAPPIDLVDGEQLVEKLRELSLGVVTRTVEVSEVDRPFFDGL